MKKIALLLSISSLLLIGLYLLQPKAGLERYEKPWHWLATRRMDTGCASYAKLKGNVDHFIETGLVDNLPELSYFYYDDKGRIAGKILAIEEDLHFEHFDHIVLDYYDDRVEMRRLYPNQLLRTFRPGPKPFFGTVYDVRLDREKRFELEGHVLRAYIADELHTEQQLTTGLGTYESRYYFQQLERWVEVELDEHDNPASMRLGHRSREKTLQQKLADGFKDTSTVQTKIVPLNRFEYNYDQHGNWIKCTITLLNEDGSDLDSSHYSRIITYRE